MLSSAKNIFNENRRTSADKCNFGCRHHARQPYFEALTYGGNFHTVGAVLTPLPVPAFTLIAGDRSVSGSATGTPYELRKLMRFAARSKVAPTTELFPMSKINDAIQHVRDGKARYRVVLKADF